VPHIELPPLPGITALFEYRPETAVPLLALADALLHADNSLTRGERELIAAYVSGLNDCRFCCDSHRAFAGRQLEGGAAVVDAARADLDAAPVSPKLRALLRVAAEVVPGGRNVRAETIEAAKAAGATDVEVHDTVLIAAAFCMFNRYVDGLGTWAPDDPSAYDQVATMIAEHGYGRRPGPA
jgi:uncharacterized peroxidase-related enzyme